MIRAVFEHVRPRLVSTFLLVGLAAVLEGLGLVLILPVIEVVFAQEVAGPGSVAVAWLSRHQIDTALKQLLVLGLGFLILIVARANILRWRDIRLMKLSQGFVDSERRRLFSLLAETDWPIIKRYRKADLLNSLTTNIGRLAVAMNFLTSGLVTTVLALAALGAAFVVSWSLGLLLLLLTTVSGILARVWSKRSRRSGERLNHANRNVMSVTTRFLDGLKAAKAMQAESELKAGFDASIAKARSIQLEFADQQARLRSSIQIAAALAALFVLLSGYALFGLTGGELIVMAAIVLRLAPSLLSTMSGIQSLAHCWPAYTALQALEQQLASDRHFHAFSTEADSAPVADQHEPAGLAVRNASVQVRDEQGNVVTLLETESFDFPAGAVVHVGGHSGAGKSTFAELVAGLHLPAAGRVCSGGLSLTRATRERWQADIVFVPQEPFLFDGTVRQNLLWPQTEASDEMLWQALRLTRAGDVVRSLPGALGEMILDGGARLSGGERQRLCLARALVRPARMLILDEATSAVGPDIEREIIRNIRSAYPSSVVLNISHSPNAQDLADMHVEVSHGRARLRQA
ncbi:ATP-binding cassette domain-containing protein [Aurantiacibacter poecillastricola]|uniref:ATP-binding cassette domain-containing protein n=1 Tax=Aurantiacibacter poecillastricola TaxID=3064385 RepID=UPI00274003F8|nr:ABC transporter ATP-binding protein [Aurantiacibacter sp. 219JJ12-13]MDP5263063.1 ABC transporter ATP-binding protein [Aurantiacibacter sp. 219JJ12-13]